MKSARLACSLGALLVASAAFAAPAAESPAPVSDAQYAAVLNGSWRLPQNSARDRYRHPQQTLRFFGLGERQTVVEITPGDGWYSELLAPLLKDHGRYVAAVVNPAASDYARKAEDKLRQKFAADPARYGKAQIVEYDPRHPLFGSPASADLVLTFRNVHNWVMAGNQAAMFEAFYAVLKPGGTLGVVDHRARPGTALDKDSGYLPTAYVVQLAQAAGFVLAGESEVNANPRDSKDYPKGVWTLPPTLAEGEHDRERYLAIGESDRMTLRFVKPAKPAQP